MSVKIYDPARVTIAIAGIPIDPGGGAGGYAEGDFLTIVKDSKKFEDKVGVDGEVTRSKSYDARATATLRLMQSSSSNPLLAALVLLDENADNGAGVGAFRVEDLNGTSLYSGDACWIANSPDPKFGPSAQDRVWEIRIANLVDFTGGN